MNSKILLRSSAGRVRRVVAMVEVVVGGIVMSLDWLLREHHGYISYRLVCFTAYGYRRY